MTLPFNKLNINFDVRSLSEFLDSCDLWDKYNLRRLSGSPHEQMTDIWARFNNPDPYIESGNIAGIIDKHDSVWLENIPAVKFICDELLKFLYGSKLGGVLITKLPPRGRILPHTDHGWHAEYYDKYYVPIKNGIGSRFCFDRGELIAKNGEVYAFRNDVTHWVENDSNHDRIAMIICIKQRNFTKEGLCLGA